MDNFKKGDVVYLMCKKMFGHIEGREYSKKLKNGSVLVVRLEPTSKMLHLRCGVFLTKM